MSVVDDVAEGLWRRLRDVLRAERRLEAFAFTPECPPAGGGAPGRLEALLADDAALAGLAREVALRALAAGADPITYRMLGCLGGGPVAVDDMARATGLAPLAVSERVNALSQLGLAVRELENDAVAEAPAGRGLVALVDGIAAGLAARCRAGAGALR
jgi:hypothetical protein